MQKIQQKPIKSCKKILGSYIYVKLCYERALRSFNRQLRLEETWNMKGTVLTDFFQKI